MKKSKFSEKKILAILKENDQGLKVAESYRKRGVTD